MKTPLALLSIVSLLGAAVAQSGGPTTPLCDTNPNGAVGLRINGVVPSGNTAVEHDVSVSSAVLSLNVSGTAAGRSFALLFGAAIACPGIPVPWTATVDLAQPVVVLDGFFPATFFDALAVTPFQVAVPVGCALQGTVGPAIQAIYAEPQDAPYFLNNTTAGRPFFTATATTTYSLLGDDDFVGHTLVCPITFGGQSYTQLYCGSNGQVTFRNGDTDPSPTPSEFFAGFQSAPTPAAAAATTPGVAVLWADFHRSTYSGDSVVVDEDRSLGTVKVSYLGMQWYNSQNPAGDFAATFGALGPGSVVIDLTQALPGAGDAATPGQGTFDPNPIVGVSRGRDATGANTILDFSAALAAGGGTYTTPLANVPESVMEQFPLAGADPMAPLDAVLLRFVDATGTFTWTIY